MVGAFSLMSKFMGVFRESIIAGNFGVGAVADAFHFSISVPILFLTSVGGLNGALHSAIVSVLPRSDTEEFEEMVQVTSTRIGVAMAALSLAIAIGARFIIGATAPGLPAATAAQATIMLQTLSPMILISGWMGVGVGALVARGAFLLPSAIPLIGNLVFILIMLAIKAASAHHGQPFGGQQLAQALLLSTTCQWLAQNLALRRAGMRLRMRWGRTPAQARRFRGVMAVALPAAMSACALNVAAFTDLFFASYIPGAAASIGYALLIGMAPFGIISSGVLVPLLPLLTSSRSGAEALRRLSHVIMSLLCVALPLAALMAVLAPQMVFVMLSGHAFQAAEVAAVAALLPHVVCCGLTGMLRDLVTRVYYAQARGRYPMAVSVAMIVANAALDWVSVQRGWGAEGLLLATALTNGTSVVLLCAGLRGVEGAGRTGVEIARGALAVGVMAGAAAVTCNATLSALPTATTCLSSRAAAVVTCGVCSAAACAVFMTLMVLTRVGALDRQREQVLRVLRLAG